jgi:hypothetical protein
MPDRSKGEGQAKCSPWSSRLEVGRGSDNATPENLLLGNLQSLCSNTMEEVKTHTGL